MRITFIMTEKCNFSCSYCFSNIDREGRISYEIMEKAILEHVGDLKSIAFFGGEPLLEFPLIQKVTDRLLKPNGINALLVTNGSLLTDEIIEWLGENSETIHKVIISYDGKFQYLRDWNTKLVEDKINKLSLAYLGILNINHVLSEQSIQGLNENIQYIFDTIHFNRLRLRIDWWAVQKNPELFQKVFRKMPELQSIKENLERIYPLNEKPYGDIGDMKSGGCFGIDDLTYDPSGKEWWCHRAALDSQNDRFEINSNIQLHEIPRQCNTCQIGGCPFCAVTCKWSTGRWDQIDPALCETWNVFYESWKRLMMI